MEEKGYEMDVIVDGMMIMMMLVLLMMVMMDWANVDVVYGYVCYWQELTWMYLGGA